ncbi:MAG TPA: methyltransferase dimerization domain-containing protein, partial [Thermoanaerobaculia bacterium]|nr:methyltransferase dimerization domain-containing protein [Thermoanaerobaculia bacterium]
MKYGAIPVNPLERLALLTGMVPIPAVDALYGLVKARSLMAAVRLGLFEALRGGPRSPEAVAGELGLDAECTGLLMRALAYADYLEQEPRGYRLSRISRRSLLAGSPMDMRGFVEWNYHQWQLLDHLEALVETGQGADFHLVMKDPALWAAYQRAMLDIARLPARVVAKKVPVRP